MRFFHKLREYIGIDIILQIIGMAALGLLAIGLAVFFWQRACLPSAEAVERALADRPEGRGPFVFSTERAEWYDLEPTAVQPYTRLVLRGDGYIYRPWDEELLPISDTYTYYHKDGLFIQATGTTGSYYVVTAVDLS